MKEKNLYKKKLCMKKKLFKKKLCIKKNYININFILNFIFFYFFFNINNICFSNKYK